MTIDRLNHDSFRFLSGVSRSAMISLALGLASVTAAPAMAAEAQAAKAAANAAQPKPDPNALEEVVVTARFKTESVQKSAVAISALTSSQLEARGFVNITNVSAAVPNVNLSAGTSGYGKSTFVSIRGVGQNDFKYTFEPGVAFYIDDVYFGSVFGSMFDLSDVDRVEILRGPQGTLFGKNTEGGAVRLFNKKPQGDNTGTLQIGYGSYNRQQASGSFDGAIIPDQLLFRLFAGTTRSEGYMDRLDFACANPTLAGNLKPNVTSTGGGCKIGTSGGEDTFVGHAALRYIASDNLEININGDLTDDKGEAGPEKLLAVNLPPNSGASGPGTTVSSALANFNSRVAIPVFGIPLDSRFITSSPYTSYNTYNDPLTNTTSPSTSTNFSYGISATIDWTTPWDGIHVKSITADRRYHGAFAEDNFDAPITANMFSNRVFHHQFSQEEQISGKLLNETLEWVIGGYYLHISDFNSGVVDQGASGPQNKGILFYTGDPAISDDGSAFVHLNYRATDKLSFELGGRYSDQSKTYQFYRYLPNLTGVVPAGTFLLNTALRPASGYLAGFDPPLPGGEIKSSRVDPKLGVQYQWTPDLMTYFQYSTGFKSGGFNPRPLTPAQVTTFAPETLDAYEVGVKSEWFERRLRGNLTGFVSEYKGLQLPVLTLDKSGTPANLVQSVGRARIQGIEFEMEARPTQDLAINGSIGYLNYKALDLAGAAYDPVNNTSGPVLSNVAPLTPKLKVNVGAQYGFDLGSLGTITPRVDYTYTSKIYYDAQNSPIAAQNGYGLVNLRLHWMSANSHWESSLAVSNATSQIYYANKANSLGNYNVVTGVPGKPREVLFTIKRFF